MSPDAIDFAMLKLGKLPTTQDPRTIQYRSFATPWTPPASYNFDNEHGNVCPPRMYRNDVEGDCVIVGEVNHQTRMELDEQHVVINVTDDEVHTEYRIQTGGPDSGLYPLESAKKWRKGWRMAGRLYRIHSFAQVTPQDVQQTKEAAVVGRGLQIAVNLPIDAQGQLNARVPWDLTTGPGSAAGSWGGHQMYMRGYDSTHVEFWTWARVQRATWRWLAAYSDFALLPVDDVNGRIVSERVNVSALEGALADIR